MLLVTSSPSQALLELASSREQRSIWRNKYRVCAVLDNVYMHHCIMVTHTDVLAVHSYCTYNGAQNCYERTSGISLQSHLQIKLCIKREITVMYIAALTSIIGNYSTRWPQAQAGKVPCSFLLQFLLVGSYSMWFQALFLATSIVMSLVKLTLLSRCSIIG